MTTIRAREPVKYKRPGRINTVSVSVFATMGLMVYLGYCFYPALALKSSVKTELHESVNEVYTANLRPAAEQQKRLRAMEKNLIVKLRKMGVRDENLQIKWQLGRESVTLEAKFDSTVTFIWLDKTYTVSHNPRVETDAARVDW
jgi:hypothetical protein